MTLAPHDLTGLVGEHHTLLRQYGRVQARCSELVRRQAAEIERLQAQAIRLRAAVIVRDTALAWAREQRSALEAAIPGLPRRLALAERVDALVARVQDLMRERLHWHWQRHAAPPPPAAVAAPTADDPEDVEDLAALEDSLVAADLVICQTGCLSHGAYWRVQDHCQRTGKACLLVDQPDAVRVVRIDRPPGRRPQADAAATREPASP